MVLVSDQSLHRFLRFHFSVSSLVLVSIEKIYQTLEIVFDRISKPTNFVKNTLLGVVFSTLFSGFGNVIKPYLAGLIYSITS